MDKIIVTIIGILSITFIYWFFLGKKDEEVEVRDKIEIIVNDKMLTCRAEILGR